MKTVEITDKHWPAVVTVVSPGDVTDADMHEANEQFLAIIRQRRAPYVTITDLRRGGRITPRQRKIIADFMNEHRDVLDQYCAGAAMVFDSALLRAMLTAVLWMTQPKWETKVFATLEEALAWAHERAKLKLESSARATGT